MTLLCRTTLAIFCLSLFACIPANEEVKDKDEGTSNEYITVSQPRAGDSISSPLTIKGQARGMWYFEATFPVVLTDWDGLIIAQGYAQAEGEWMTEDFVPFSATLTFTKPAYGERGTLILKKDNPSGLPEHDDAVEIPVLFK